MNQAPVAPGQTEAISEMVALGYAQNVYQYLTDPLFFAENPDLDFNYLWGKLTEISERLPPHEETSEVVLEFIALVLSGGDLDANTVSELIAVSYKSKSTVIIEQEPEPEEFVPEVVYQLEEAPETAPEPPRTLTYAFDVEVFPNFCSVVFIDADDTDRHVFYLHPDDPNVAFQYDQLVKFINRDITLVGYNSVGYDEYILKALVQRWKGRQVFRLSSGIISGDYDLKELRFMVVPWRMIDLQKVAGAFCSLKQIAVNMQWHRIQDLPLPFNTQISLAQVDEILSYNVNDVEITKALYWEIKDELDLRAGISEQFKVRVHSESRSGVANRLLEKMYADHTKQDRRLFKEGRTPRIHIYGSDCVSPKVKFNTLPLQTLLEELQETQLDGYEKFKAWVHIAGVTYDLGVGGLHSRDQPGILVSTDQAQIIDADVSSYYPMIALTNGYGPEHLGESFIEVFRAMTEARLAAKKAGEKLKADALKITINSIFGKMNFENYWLYDPLAFYSITINGQLFLLMLIERFVEAGIEVLSANTDGVVCMVRNDQKSEYDAICEQWQVDTDFELEYTPYAKFIRKDVNNYIVIKPDDSLKAKGSLDERISLTGGYKYPIVKKAISDYFVHGTPIQETFDAADNILDFCLSQKVSRSKFAVVEFKKNGVVTEMQWTNRYFVSKKGGELTKIKHDGKRISLVAGYLVEVINDLDMDRPISDYDIYWRYYRREAQAVIDLIDPPVVQLSLL